MTHHSLLCLNKQYIIITRFISRRNVSYFGGVVMVLVTSVAA